MTKNKRYGKITQNNTIEYAPRVFKEDDVVVAPKIDDDNAYHSRGWYTVVDAKPSYDTASQHIQLSTWVENDIDMAISAVYQVIDNQPSQTIQVRRFSKLKLVEFCIEQGIWNELKSFLEKTGYYDLFVMAVYFLENDKFFMMGLQAFQQNKAQEPGYDSTAFQHMIDLALQYAFDSYEVVQAEQEHQTEEE